MDQKLAKAKHKIAVIGGLGNMGRRYCSILDYLGISFYVIDLNTERKISRDTTGIIIATPTSNHYATLDEIKEFNIPILCEKPIATDKSQLDDILKMPCKLRMINQYQFFLSDGKECKIQYTDGSHRNLKTVYNYYNSGQDSIDWDCINIIGLDEGGNIKLSNKAPIWECTINSVPIPRDEMDRSYIWNIQDWLEKYDDNKKYIDKAHRKVFERIQNVT